MSSTLVDCKRVSKTAYDCAALRAAVYSVTRLASFDYLAAYVVRYGSASFRARLGVELMRIGAHGIVRALIARISEGAEVFLFARQAIADEMIRMALNNNPRTQVVLLGAGLDTSGLRIGNERREAGLPSGRFFEIDLPEMQNEKRKITKPFIRSRASLDDSHIRYISCSFGESDISHTLLTAGFERNQPTVWIWAGVIHYLKPEAVESTIAEIRDLSQSGSQLFFDFVLQEAYENPTEYGFARTKKRFDAFGEVMSFGFRQGTEHVSGWLNRHGIRLVRLYTNVDTVELYEQMTGRPAWSLGTRWSSLCTAEL